MSYILDHRIVFPHPSLADDDGLLAIGGDLSVERLLLAYQNGIFPWYTEDTPILWYAPHERFVLLPKELIIHKSMKQFIRNTDFMVRCDTVFSDVLQKCASIKRAGQDGTWLTNDMQQAYIKLHELGIVHSIETFTKNGDLVGGLYGVQVGRVFCGESMFSEVSNASKLALLYLCQHFDFELIDCQVYSEHLASLGAKYMSTEMFLRILQQQEYTHDRF